MAGYHYKLETLLAVRRNFEEQCQQKLAHEIFVLDNHKAYLEQLKKERQQLVELLEVKKREGVTAAVYSFYVDAIRNKERMIEFQKNAIAAQEQIIDGVRKELLAKVMDRKVVERLKEKDHLEWLREVARKEQNENDEQAVLRFGREVLA